jgi:hypothetical protein
VSVVERVNGFRVTVGGEQHSGWLPAGAAIPLPNPVREVDLDFAIESVGAVFLLLVESRDGCVSADTWHETIDDARGQAAAQYGVPREAWGAVAGGGTGRR